MLTYYIVILFKKDWYDLTNFFLKAYILCEQYKKNPAKVEPSSCILNMLCVMDFSLIWLSILCEIYLIPIKSRYTAFYLSVNNET